MSTSEQQERARKMRDTLNRAGKMPSHLRAPLDAVIDNTESANSAEDVLAFADDVIVLHMLRPLRQ